MARFLLLGAAQDAGVPQIGCNCQNCCDAREGRAPLQWAVSGALLDDATHSMWLLDCGPDIKRQWDIFTATAPGAWQHPWQASPHCLPTSCLCVGFQGLVNPRLCNRQQWGQLPGHVAHERAPPPPTHAPLCATGYSLRGVLLTHCHMGHYIGLAQFGKEGMNVKGLVVSAALWLPQAAPWSPPALPWLPHSLPWLWLPQAMRC